MNYYTLATEGDERRFAKLAAQRSRSELVEHLADGTATKLDGALCGSRSMTPAFYVSEFLHGKFERELADMTQATAFFQGGGGDGVFLQNGAELAPTDYVRRNGMGPRLLQISHDAAQITQLSLWKLVASGIWAALRKRRLALPIDAPLSSTFIAPSVLERISSERKALSHPLLRDVESVPEGKLWHILLTSAPPEFTRPYKQFDRPGIVFPLISQPIHELCLRIPTYLMFDGGRDRALARKAFKNDVPSEIIRRRGKGGADRVIQEIIRANIRFVRDILLDGALAKQGIVGRADLETSLKNVQTMEPAACDEAMLLFEIEVFLQIWRGVERRAAA